MFFEKYESLVKEKKSIININLDPALPNQRKNFIIPDTYLREDESETVLNFSFDVIEKVSDYCCSVKPNLQYFISDSKILGKVVEKIHEEGMVAVLDYKLGDIGSTNEISIDSVAKMGFDAFTFSPFAGNIHTTVEYAHMKKLGVFVLTLMSNPEAETFMLNAKIKGADSYQYIANEVKRTNADGCVVGLTGFVTEDHIRKIQNLSGDGKVFLLQGIGPQGGNESDVNKVRIVKNPLVSLGREVIFSKNITEYIRRYNDLLNKVRI